jgi:NADPH:quinone reductase-like Zn-dependent oxidoreductase
LQCTKARTGQWWSQHNPPLLVRLRGSVTFSRGDSGRALYVLGEIGELIESGRFSLPVTRTFPLAEIAQAHRVGEDGHVRGKLVLLVG